MIRYRLRCADGHEFDSWFQSAEAFGGLSVAGQLSCGICGGGGVVKALMAPKVANPDDAPGPGSLTPPPANPMEQALAAMRRHVEQNSEYVGLNFAAEARAIHDGDRPERSIHGEARWDEAKKLIEDGVPVAPLPFMPARKVN